MMRAAKEELMRPNELLLTLKIVLPSPILKLVLLSTLNASARICSCRLPSENLKFLKNPAFQLKYIGPLMKFMGRLPVEPGAFRKKTCPGNGAVPIGLAPRMVRLLKLTPAGSGCVRSTTTPAAVLACNTLGSIKKTPPGVLKTPISFLISFVVKLEVAG